MRLPMLPILALSLLLSACRQEPPPVAGSARSGDDARRRWLVLPDAVAALLFCPVEGAVCQVEQIPVLGTGKLDLRAIRELALEMFHART